MELPATDLNLQLRKVVEHRISAELSAVSGRAGFWRCVGLGLVGLGLGCFLGLSFYGYSILTRKTTNFEILTSALTKSLSGIQLRGTSVGTVQIEPQEISLAKNQTISIDPNSRLILDPSARIVAEGEIRVQLPTLTSTISPPRQSSSVPLITNFTIFKSVPFEKGAVYTGWSFLTSAQQSPSSQYCYYSENADVPDLSLRIELGKDRITQSATSAPKTFDFAGATERCVWFKGDQ